MSRITFNGYNYFSASKIEREHELALRYAQQQNTQYAYALHVMQDHDIYEDDFGRLVLDDNVERTHSDLAYEIGNDERVALNKVWDWEVGLV